MRRPSTSSPARRARSGLLWFVVAALVLQVGMGPMVTRRWSDVLDPAYHEKLSRLRKLVAAAPPEAYKVLGLGTSRMEFGLHAQALADELGRPACCFNLALPGAGPVRNLINLRRVLADGFRPDLVLVEVMPPLFARGNLMGDVTAGVLPVPSLRYEELELLQRYDRRPGLRWEWARSVLTAWHHHRFAIVKKFAPRLLPPRQLRPEGIEGRIRDEGPDGWYAFRVRADEAALISRAARDFFRGRLKRMDADSPMALGLRDLLVLCRDEGLPAALVLMPEGPTFRGWYGSRFEAELKTFLAGLERDFGVRTIDARGWVDEELFVDSHHLIAEGAEVFTRRLGAEAIGR